MPTTDVQTKILISSGTVKPFNGVLKGIKLSGGTTVATCQAKNTATGVTIGHAVAAATVTAPDQKYDVEFDTSLYVTLAGTGAVVVIEYQ